MSDEPRERLARDLLAAHRGWDRPPALGLVFADEAGALRPVVVPVPDEVWSGRDPVRVVIMVAISMVVAIEATGGRPGGEIGGAFAGCWLAVEGWQAPPDRREQTRQRIEAGAPEPRFADMLGAIEVKQVTVTDLDGGALTVLCQRGAGDVLTMDRSEGRIPDVLRMMTSRLAACMADR